MKRKIWILKDKMLSNFSQAKGLANGFDPDKWSIEVKEIHYNSFASLPNVLRKGIFLGLDKKKSDDLTQDFPDLVISSGRRLAPIALYVKRLSAIASSKAEGRKPKSITKVAHIMKPDMNLKPFDFLLLPTHDIVSEQKLAGHPGIIRIIGALSKINPQVIEDLREHWEEKFKGFPRNKIALLVGGKAKNVSFTPEEASSLAKISSRIASDADSMLLVTNSRRTGVEQTQALKDNITCSNFFYDVNKPVDENPFFGFFALAKYIIVTSDSISMCSECCSSGRKIYIYNGPNMLSSRKHIEFLRTLIAEGYAEELTEDTVQLNDNNIKILEEGKKAAKIISERI